MNKYSAVVRKYADFHGRASRSEYWMWILMNSIIISLLSVIDIFLLNLGMYGLSFVYFLVIALPTLAVLVRRLHDTGHSGWWGLLPFCYAWIYRVVPHSMLVRVLPPSSWLNVILSLTYILALVLLIVFLIRDSEPDQNKYGPNPKELITLASPGHVQQG
jgi:uncharacterized membrane protein YhaH (DUF805 family)